MQYKQITPATVGLTPENISKNRYKDVIPYDESRVKLTPVDGAEGSDYINASYVNGVVKDHEYIAAMGPLASTADDFWRMVWQEKVYVIITACNEYEGCPKKCHRYWSQDVLDDVEFGDISIKLDEETQESPDFICRSLRVSRGGEERLLSQLHYLSWPDRSVPSSVESILNLITTMRQKQASRSGPILVHCSAGCGRTGTIIAVDYVWNLIKLAKLPEQFSLKALVLKMRKQRPAFVQAPEQYKFLHECVAELFLQHLSKVKGHTYENCVLNEDEAVRLD
ncbi:hypothetical protein CAPTEDRAFT_133488 [Capitella teleta]|uniref:protein-tyrosine-phosphatase n=1 Tax=Capitella teleta TaxID=283909 RepID=R7T9D3_CAPTE|nr:hypothetical protein CAPTEDRAFT_133488 [Capitella teleta]|eukprot:ELT90328.1 hypothetical protein CAPTEDRAFT_133488 [Capitella teleta]